MEASETPQSLSLPLHPQARLAQTEQIEVPLSMTNVDAVRQSMCDATDVEVGEGPWLDLVADVDAAGVPARLYRPGLAAPGTLLYAHGGGWVLGDLDTHDGLCRHLAAATGWAVLAVDYRRAPEDPHPAALHDVERALGWLRDTGAALHGLHPARIAVAGDSAGGHLAAVLARRARDAGSPLAGQVLICPVIDPAMRYPDLGAYGLTAEEMHFFWDCYAPGERTGPDLDPLRADLAGLPPAVVITAELDVLRDEAERYAARMLAADVPVLSVRYQGVTHNFVRKLALFDAAHAALAQIAAVVRRW